ncbi:MAG: glycosyltransferase family 4 protein [Acidimicrobiia bacterium]|nr:glycosyltransferase family 4 protein [Acidimicrobiia bacterium]
MSSPRLRVALDATSLLGPLTGVGVFTSALLHHLPSDIDVVAYATSWRGRGRLSAQLPTHVTASTRPQAARPLREIWRRANWPPIELWTGPVDVVHGTNFVVPPTRAGSVVSVHDLTFHHHPEMCTAPTLQYPSLIRRAIARGAWVHTDSQFVADEVVEVYGAAPERVVAVPLGVHPPVHADAAEGHRIAGGDRYVVAVGTVEPRKDLPLLVEAFDELAATDPELRLVHAGPDGWGADAFTERIDRSPHRDRIVRLGWVDDATRSALLHGAAVLAYPSRYEGFGLPPLEAMSVGTPVVATAVGSLPEVLGDAAILVPPSDASALAEALALVIDDVAERARLVRLGIARATHHRWDRCAAGMVALYRRAAA